MLQALSMGDSAICSAHIVLSDMDLLIKVPGHFSRCRSPCGHAGRGCGLCPCRQRAGSIVYRQRSASARKCSMESLQSAPAILHDQPFCRCACCMPGFITGHGRGCVQVAKVWTVCIPQIIKTLPALCRHDVSDETVVMLSKRCALKLQGGSAPPPILHCWRRQHTRRDGSVQFWT